MPRQITGSKLPSDCQVLRISFYNMRQAKLNTGEAAKLTKQEVIHFWEKTKILTRHVKDCVAKLEKLCDQWKKLQKHITRLASSVQNQKVKDFKSILDDLFDITHQGAL